MNFFVVSIFGRATKRFESHAELDNYQLPLSAAVLLDVFLGFSFLEGRAALIYRAGSRLFPAIIACNRSSCFGSGGVDVSLQLPHAECVAWLALLQEQQHR